MTRRVRAVAREAIAAAIRAAAGLAPVSWQSGNALFVATFAGVLGAFYVFILLVDPYGVVPFSLPFERPIMTNQRQVYPQILRTGRYDSVVVGTSTSRLLDPEALGRVLGGRFASFAMPSMTAWEQARIIDWFGRAVPSPRTVVVGLDHEWCDRDTRGVADREMALGLEREFPAWAYDENRWNDLLYLLNAPTLEVASKVVGRLRGRSPGKLREDGFEVFVPPEANYDPARARAMIWGAAGPPAVRPFLAPLAPPLQLSAAERAAMPFEALPWLEDSLAALPAGTAKILVFTPPHAHALPASGTPAEARERECKDRVAAIARRHGAVLVDWRLVSPLTVEDANYWDLLHYRLPIAYALIEDLGHAVNDGRESPDGRYRILVR